MVDWTGWGQIHPGGDVRSRSLEFPWPSKPSSNPDVLQPVDVPYLVANRWVFRNKTWLLTVNVTEDDGVHTISYSFSVEIGWNYSNTYDPIVTILPSPGFPLHEAFLPLGWQIADYLIGGVASVGLFQANFANVLAGAGIEYSAPDLPTKPYLSIAVGAGNTNRNGTSAAGCYVDGIRVPWGEPVGITMTGLITLDPYTFWEYRRSDGTNPMYDAAGVAILPRQTDELS